MNNLLEGYLDSVAFDVRIIVPAKNLTELVRALESFLESRGVVYEYPSDDGLPTEHTLPIFAGVDEND